MNNQKLTEDLINHIADQFDLLKDRFKMSYDEFNAFSLGYTMGVIATLKDTKKRY